MSGTARAESGVCLVASRHASGKTPPVRSLAVANAAADFTAGRRPPLRGPGWSASVFGAPVEDGRRRASESRRVQNMTAYDERDSDETYRTVIEQLKQRGVLDTAPHGSSTGPEDEWVYSFSEDYTELHHYIEGVPSYTYKARFEFMRVDGRGYRYDGHVVVTFREEHREDHPNVVLDPSVYARWYDLKPPEERQHRADKKKIGQVFFATDYMTASPDVMQSLFDQAAACLTSNAEVCQSERRREIARRAEHYWNDTPETEASSLTDF